MLQHKFSAQTKMSDLIHQDIYLLSTISRFGISLGFGDKTIGEACKFNNIDTTTFLAVLNFQAEGYAGIMSDYSDISIEAVINYLKNAHTYFLTYKLPSIRSKLIEVTGSDDMDKSYNYVFLKYFDEYVVEVKKHMEYEDKIVFPYAMKILNGKKDKKYTISVFEDHHTDVDSKLAELKNILAKYYPAKGSNYLLNEVLFDLLSCEKDLASHNQVEDFFFVPAIERIEQKLGNSL